MQGREPGGHPVGAGAGSRDDTRVGPPAGAFVGVGVDIEAVERWQAPDRRLFTNDEVMFCAARADQAEAFAGTWCAKEAVVKAVFPHSPILTRDVSISRLPSGAPVAEIPTEIPLKVQLSISHHAGVAVAVAIAVST